jgi:hypothetical protein
LIWFALAVFTDERYVVVVIFVLACIALYPGVVATSRRALTLAGAAVAIVAANFLLKTFVLHSRFFTGTAGQQLGFDPKSIATYLATGFMNVLGFNIGPIYLAGRDAFEGPVGVFFGLVFSAGAVIVAIAYFRLPRAGERVKHWRPVVLAAALFLPLLLSASVAVRQDPRWLYAPFAVFLLALSGAAGSVERGKRANAVAVTMLAACLLATVYYRSSIGSIYFFYSMTLAHSVRETLANDPPETVVFQTHGADEVHRWIFANDEFFDEYGLRDSVRYVNELNGATEGDLPSSPIRIFDIRGTSVADITGTVRNRAQTASGSPEFRRISLVDAFPHGTINSHRHVETPTGQGALILDWPSNGGPIHSLTILAGFQYEFAGIQVNRGDALVFSAADPYALGGGTRAFIAADMGPKRSEIFHGDFKPAASASAPDWQTYSVSLDRFAGGTISLTFGVDTLTADATAAWLAFGDPRIVGENDRHKTTLR